jgi:hypothetical protein
MRHHWNVVIATGILVGLVTSAPAALVYDESVNPDFSGNRLLPTGVSIASPGTSQINGVTGNTGSTAATADRDYFTITIPNGFILNSLILTNFSMTAGNLGFLGVAPGGTAPDPTLAPATLEAALVGYTHLSPSMNGTNILPAIGHAVGSPGFLESLSAGTYTFWLQDTSSGTSDPYTLTLNVELPEPASLVLMLTGLGGLGWARHRRRRSPAG